jgi:drug/metabolite transporter (DMT)-like permease
MMMFGAVIFNLLYLTELSFDGNLMGYFSNLNHIELILPILYLGTVASIGGFFLVNFALSKAPAHITSIYSNLSTIVAVIAGALLLNEPLQYYHLIGSLMIVSGVYGTVSFRKHRDRRVV